MVALISLAAIAQVPASGLLVWLKADAGVDTLNGTVSRWHDQSGNGYDAIQTNTSRQPLLVANALNGKPVLRFDGFYQRLEFTNSTLMSEFTIFMVVKNDSRGGWDQWYFILFMGVDNFTDRIEIGGPDGGIRAVAPNISAYGEWRNISIETNQLIFSTTLRWNGSDATMIPVVGTNMSINAPMGTGGGIAGTDGDPSGNLLTAKCDFAEVIIYSRVVSDSERIAVENYLSDKYNIVSGIQDPQEKIIPEQFKLSQNYPDPFNPKTTINYQLPQTGFVTLKVYDMLGREVAKLVSKQQAQGSYSINFDASDLASGVYVYQMRINNYVDSKKMLLLK